MNLPTSKDQASGIPTHLQPPTSLTGQKPTPLPSKYKWVEDLLVFLRGATKRLHPQPLLEVTPRRIKVRFYHQLPFNRTEAQLIWHIILEHAAQNGEEAKKVNFSRKWVSFEIHIKKGRRVVSPPAPRVPASQSERFPESLSQENKK